MEMRRVLYIATLVCVLGVHCQNDTETTAPPITKEIALQSGICRVCKCLDTKIDCFDKDVQDFFTKDQWNDLIPLKPVEVDLGENPLSSVTHIPELPVQVLNLTRCSINSIENASFKDLRGLTTLDLSYNKLNSANLSPHAFEGRYSPEAYEPLSAMKTLNLAHNDLHSLHQDLFEHLPELESLDLSGNPLATIDHVTIIAISSLPMLKVLRLRSCEIPEIPDKFLHTPRYLERLDISDNRLLAVPQELAEAKNLRFLNLNQNPIAKLDTSDEVYPGFPRLRKLEELHMCRMPALKTIGAGALSGLENLRSLHMSWNPSLSFLHPRALARPDDAGEGDVWPPVKELHLQSNNLSEVDRRLLARWDGLTTVDLGGNPLLCDCSTQWMVDVLVPIVDHATANASADMVCKEPIEMRGYTMQHLNDIHRIMRCVDKYGHRPERDGAILLGTLIGVLLALPIMLSLTLMWRHGYFSRCGLRGPVDVSRAFYKRAPADEFMT